MNRREEVLAAITRLDQRMVNLRSEIDATTAELLALRKELASLPPEIDAATPSADPAPYVQAPISNSDKISLFRSLFRGREDVFALRWESQKTGRSGYSPAYTREWKQKLFDERRMGGRPKPPAIQDDRMNEVYLPLTDDEIAKHLKGTHIMGIYPLLPDDTCWLLAADFDKRSWQEDIGAFVSTCRAHEMPVAIERSRSGNGAHAWFFFASPVPASVARRMGCFLLTETMVRRHQLSMESYDRLFPNQDTMPRGGFGNLIALPLQGRAREQGNSVFVDDSLNPHPDQGLFLANVRRIQPGFVQKIAGQAERRHQVFAVGVREVPSEKFGKPALSLPAKPSLALAAGVLPPKVNAVLSQRLLIEKAVMPHEVTLELRRLAAFQNPEFYRKQNFRLSTAFTPMVITCFEELDEHIALPRGCLGPVQDLCREYGIQLDLKDERESGIAIDVTFHGSLTPVQEQAVKELLAHDTGVFVAPPGIGKTVAGIRLIAERKRSTLILVHRKPILDQWIAQLARFLDMNRREIGQIGGGKNKLNGRLDVAMIQSLVRKGRVNEVVAGYGNVIVDECHHLPAVSFERVLSAVRARYVTGLTATPHRRDGHDPIIPMQLGPIRFSVSPRDHAAKRPFSHTLVVRETRFKPRVLSEPPGIQELYAELARDQDRNDFIFDDVVGALEAKRSPLLLTERRDHLDHFAERLRAFTRNLVVLHGGMKTKERRDVLARLASIPDGEERLLLATGRFIGEGFDDARLDTLFLSLPVSWKGTLVQYAGRLHRLHPTKTDVRIYDYVDREVPMLLRMFEKRMRGYRAIGYSRDETLASAEPAENRIILEYDEDALRSLEREE